MKANELRIGNYVLDINQSIVEVESITSYGINLTCDGNSVYPDDEINHIKPIPLTEELFKNLTSNFTKGQNKTGGIWVAFHNMHLDLYWNEKDKYYYYHTNELQSKPILFVHRFQNLIYELSDIELTLKN